MSGPPPYDDGPQKDKETTEQYAERLFDAREAMGIQRRPQFPNRPERENDEDETLFQARVDDWLHRRENAEQNHLAAIDSTNPDTFDIDYYRKFMAERTRRRAHNKSARRSALAARRNYDSRRKRPRVSTPSEAESEGDLRDNLVWVMSLEDPYLILTRCTV
jgi:hypothetical protein